MSKAKKSWREKLADDKGLPRVAPIDGRMSRRWGEGSFVIPAPREVDALMQKVRRGRLTTIDELRRVLARRHGATIACPITTGIFAWIAAHAAAEAEAEAEAEGRAEGTARPGSAKGAKSAARGARKKSTAVTPYWRTLKSGGELNPKYPGGLAVLRERLEAEGHSVVTRRKRVFVENFEAKLQRWKD